MSSKHPKTGNVDATTLTKNGEPATELNSKGVKSGGRPPRELPAQFSGKRIFGAKLFRGFNPFEKKEGQT